MTLMLLAITAALVFGTAFAGAAKSDHPVGAVYTLTNGAAGNAVAVFDRAEDGTLTPAGTVPTGGNGAGAALGSQGALALSDDGHELFAVNAGSNSISYFRVNHDGVDLQAVVASGGTRPISLTYRDHVLYVLNAGGAGNITGFEVKGDSLSPIAGSTRPLGTGSSGPAQVAFAPNGKTLVVTEKTSSTIDTYAVGEHHAAGPPATTAAVGGTPFGFDFDNRGDLLTSNAAGSASSYAIAKDGSVSVISGAVPTFQGAPCWLVATKDGRFAYTANAGGGTVSGFAVGHDGSLSLLAPNGASATLGAGSHPLDEAVDRDSHVLYVLVDGFHRLGAFRIAEEGSLTPIASIGGLPAGTIGLAAA
jgi:6-phosphogluconolactonase (cycloisomerase 2 family)